MTITVVPGTFTICKLPPKSPLPEWAKTGWFSSITCTDEELSVVCREEDVPADVESEPGWRGLRVAGQLCFTLVGVLSALVGPLASAGVSVFVMSTFNTDYVLVKTEQFEQALQALRQAGHHVEEPS
jgi:hypothetical protein